MQFAVRRVLRVIANQILFARLVKLIFLVNRVNRTSVNLKAVIYPETIFCFPTRIIPISRRSANDFRRRYRTAFLRVGVEKLFEK